MRLCIVVSSLTTVFIGATQSSACPCGIVEHEQPTPDKGTINKPESDNYGCKIKNYYISPRIQHTISINPKQDAGKNLIIYTVTDPKGTCTDSQEKVVIKSSISGFRLSLTKSVEAVSLSSLQTEVTLNQTGVSDETIYYQAFHLVLNVTDQIEKLKLISGELTFGNVNIPIEIAINFESGDFKISLKNPRQSYINLAPLQSVEIPVITEHPNINSIEATFTVLETSSGKAGPFNMEVPLWLTTSQTIRLKGKGFTGIVSDEKIVLILSDKSGKISNNLEIRVRFQQTLNHEPIPMNVKTGTFKGIGLTITDEELISTECEIQLDITLEQNAETYARIELFDTVNARELNNRTNILDTEQIFKFTKPAGKNMFYLFLKFVKPGITKIKITLITAGQTRHVKDIPSISATDTNKIVITSTGITEKQKIDGNLKRCMDSKIAPYVMYTVDATTTNTIQFNFSMREPETELFWSVKNQDANEANREHHSNILPSMILDSATRQKPPPNSDEYIVTIEKSMLLGFAKRFNFKFDDTCEKRKFPESDENIRPPYLVTGIVRVYKAVKKNSTDLPEGYYYESGELISDIHLYFLVTIDKPN